MVTTALAPAEQKTVLENISWATFEALLQETGANRGSRFAYDQGILEIMTPLWEHESYKSSLGNFIFVLAEELGIEIKSAGSTTLKLPGLNKSIEPDQCYYIQNESLMRGKINLDLNTDPPPDLAIEIDTTNSSVNKASIYAALGVPELWRYNGMILQFYQLNDDSYVEQEFSRAFPLISALSLTEFLEKSKTSGEMALLKSFRLWLREQLSN